MKERLKLTLTRYTHTHTNILILHNCITIAGFLYDRKYHLYISDYIIIFITDTMHTLESQNNKYSEELAAKVTRLKHVRY